MKRCLLALLVVCGGIALGVYGAQIIASQVDTSLEFMK